MNSPEIVQYRLERYVETDEILEPEFQRWLREKKVLKVREGDTPVKNYDLDFIQGGLLSDPNLIFTMLTSTPGEIFSFDKLKAGLGLRSATKSDSMRLIIHRLRSSLAKQNIDPDWVFTKQAVGYAWGVTECRPNRTELEFLRYISEIPYQSTPTLIRDVQSGVFKGPHLSHLVYTLKTTGLPPDHLIHPEQLQGRGLVEKMKEFASRHEYDKVRAQ